MTRHGKDSRRSRERELALGQERYTLNTGTVFQCEVDAYRNTDILHDVPVGCLETTAWQTISRHRNGGQHLRETQLMDAISRSSLAKNQDSPSGWSITGICRVLVMGANKHPTWMGILVQYFLNFEFQWFGIAATSMANVYCSIDHIFLRFITYDNTRNQLSSFHSAIRSTSTKRHLCCNQ